MSKSNRKKKLQPTTLDVQLARLQAIIQQNLENCEAELYQDLRINWQLFEKYAEAQKTREVVFCFLYAKQYGELLRKMLGDEVADLPDNKARVEALVKRAEQQREQMNECIEWPEGMEGGEICLESE